MEMGNLKQKIEDIRKDLVEMIREHSRSQKELWRQVPYLALEADGRDGYSDNYSRAYHTGYWAIDAGVVRGHYTVYVDLENGDLVDPYSPDEPAWDGDVLRLANSVKELNAKKILKELKEEAQEPTHAAIEHPPKRWRKRLRKELGLKKLYTRE